MEVTTGSEPNDEQEDEEEENWFQAMRRHLDRKNLAKFLLAVLVVAAIIWFKSHEATAKEGKKDNLAQPQLIKPQIPVTGEFEGFIKLTTQNNTRIRQELNFKHLVHIDDGEKMFLTLHFDESRIEMNFKVNQVNGIYRLTWMGLFLGESEGTLYQLKILNRNRILIKSKDIYTNLKPLIYKSQRDENPDRYKKIELRINKLLIRF